MKKHLSYATCRRMGPAAHPLRGSGLDCRSSNSKRRRRNSSSGSHWMFYKICLRPQDNMRLMYLDTLVLLQVCFHRCNMWLLSSERFQSAAAYSFILLSNLSFTIIVVTCFQIESLSSSCNAPYPSGERTDWGKWLASAAHSTPPPRFLEGLPAGLFCVYNALPAR